MDLPSLLAEALTARGYEVEDAPPMEGRSGATYPVSLIATQEDERVIVDVLASRAVTSNDVDALASIVDDTGVDKALLVALEGIAEEATASTEERVDLWGPDVTAEAIGAQLLEHLVDDSEVELTAHPAAALDQIGPSHAEEQPEEPTADPVEEQPAQTAASSGATLPGPDEVPNDGDAEILTDEPSEPKDEGPPRTDPQPATAKADDASDADEEGQTFLSPEEMAERAQRMLEEGELPDDGDAELIVDDDPAPSEEQPAEPADSAEPQAPSAKPSSEPEPEPEPAQEGGQVFEDADCELLPSPPKETPSEDSPPVEDPPTVADPEPEPATAAEGESPSAAAGPPSDEDEPFLSGAAIAPRIGADEAKREAQAALFQADEARLELLPFHVFAYDCVLEGDGTTRERNGRVWVSAQSGGTVDAPDGDLVDEPGIPHERFKARIEPANAANNAREHLVDRLEVRDEVREDYSETAVIERVTLTPREDTLTIEHLGTAFAPRWRVEGQNGTVFVDAITGDLVTG